MKVDVFYHDKKLGVLTDENPQKLEWCLFEYEGGYRGDSPSPLHLPVRFGLIEPHRPLQGLHGAFYDSLPDSFGEQALQLEYEKLGGNPLAMTPLIKLCCIGNRGWGALSYRPDVGAGSTDVFLALRSVALAQSAQSVLEGHCQDVLAGFLMAATPSGGAQPKINIAVSLADPDLISIGNREGEKSFESWLLKIDNKPVRESGRIEMAFMLMAKEAGIEVPACRLIEERRDGKNYAHFAVKRFDREGTRKIHAHTLASMLEVDAGNSAITYKDFCRAAKRVTGNVNEIEVIIRRGIFNFLASNCDDHAKNHAFIKPEGCGWTVSPAYDLTPSGGITLQGKHAMLPSFERPAPTLKNWQAIADEFGVSPSRIRDAYSQVCEAVSRWDDFAKDAGVSKRRAEAVRKLFPSAEEIFHPGNANKTAFRSLPKLVGTTSARQFKSGSKLP